MMKRLHFICKKLQYELVGDIELGGGKRWVQICLPNSTGTNILLAQASNDGQKQSIGNQTGGRVFLFLQTSDFWCDYQFMKDKCVEFTDLPRVEKYFTVVVFKDLYGTKWKLLQLY